MKFELIGPWPDDERAGVEAAASAPTYEELTAENDRLRAALVRYANAYDTWQANAPRVPAHYDEVCNADDAALALGRELAKRGQP